MSTIVFLCFLAMYPLRFFRFFRNQRVFKCRLKHVSCKVIFPQRYNDFREHPTLQKNGLSPAPWHPAAPNTAVTRMPHALHGRPPYWPSDQDPGNVLSCSSAAIPSIPNHPQPASAEGSPNSVATARPCPKRAVRWQRSWHPQRPWSPAETVDPHPMKYPKYALVSIRKWEIH